MCCWNSRVWGRGQVERTYAGVWKESRDAVGRHRCRWMVGILGFSSAVVGRLLGQRLWQDSLRRRGDCLESLGLGILRLLLLMLRCCGGVG
jgi:hypothetical protein